MRESEEVILYDNILFVTESDRTELGIYLKEQYAFEQVEYPSNAPSFNANAAIWAAEVVYVSAQLLLHRKHQDGELEDLLPNWENDIDASAILSADLCLRFLPALGKHLSVIEPEDKLIPIIETILNTWHYSGIPSIKDVSDLNFERILADSCVLQLYVDRVIEYQRQDLARLYVLQPWVKASLGIHSNHYWSTFTELENE
ncbi:MAG: hypothetical protein GC178_01645 [Flavobacteriales bacterium]|nr:hypothetical protein [Flavobacteriales bacterium]